MYGSNEPINGSALAPQTAVKQSAMAEATEKLDRAISMLSDRTGQLAEKLKPITLQVPEQAEGNTKNPEQVKSQFVETLATFRNRIEIVNMILGYLVRNVEI